MFEYECACEESSSIDLSNDYEWSRMQAEDAKQRAECEAKINAELQAEARREKAWEDAWQTWLDEAEGVLKDLRRRIVVTTRTNVPGKKMRLRGYVSNSATTREIVAWLDVLRQTLEFEGAALVDVRINQSRGGFVHVSGNVLSGDRNETVVETSVIDTLERLLKGVPPERFYRRSPHDIVLGVVGM